MSAMNYKAVDNARRDLRSYIADYILYDMAPIEWKAQGSMSQEGLWQPKRL
jgi:hypothetical protein